MFKIVCLAAAAVVALSANAFAGTPVWGTNVSSCVPDNSAIQPNLYLNSAGSMGFASGATGDVVVYCPIPTLASTPGNIQIGYIDDTATSLNHVKAQLIAMNYTTGAISTVTTIDSANFSSSASYVSHSLSTDFTGYNPSQNAYYIRIDLVRNGTQHETMFNVALLSP